MIGLKGDLKRGRHALSSTHWQLSNLSKGAEESMSAVEMVLYSRVSRLWTPVLNGKSCATQDQYLTYKSIARERRD